MKGKHTIYNRTFKLRRLISSGDSCILMLCAILISIIGLSSTVKAYERLKLNDPTVRQSLVSRLSHRSLTARAEAHSWALKRNIPLRHDDGRNISELMYLRNGRPIYYVTHNVDSAISIITDKARRVYGLRGAGQTIGIWDGGTVRDDHREFGERVALLDDTARHRHATGVAGTVGAAGEVKRAKGMAPEAYIDSYDWTCDVAEIASRAASFPGEPDKIYVSNHSYGTKSGWHYNDEDHNYYWCGEWKGKNSVEEFFGQYDEKTSQLDGLAYSAPYYLMFTSAGNDRNDNPSFNQAVYFQDELNEWKRLIYNSETCPLGDGKVNGGYGTISTFGVAKNIMTVGAIENTVRIGMHYVNADMTNFSSWGPADDGRIKPDVVAHGSYLYTTASGSASDYQTESGTSFSCPSVSGSALLLTEYYTKLFPDADTGKLCQGVAMRASTLKGLIIHTADDLGRPGPDYCYGWGLMNTEAAVELIKRHHEESSGSMLAEMTLYDEDPEDTYYVYSNGNEPIRITLSWTDPPAEGTDRHNEETPCLQNDLNVRLVGPDGEIYYPYVLNPDHRDWDAATGDNYLDNIEQIEIDAPLAAGTYTVTVSYTGTLLNQEQGYSLISTQAMNKESDQPLARRIEISTPLNHDVSIKLVGLDDGLPDPTTDLTYLITSLPSHGSLIEEDSQLPIAMVPHSIAANGNTVVYIPDLGYVGSDSFAYVVSDNSELSEEKRVSVEVVNGIFAECLEVDPLWQTTGEWEWGVPAGFGGSSHGYPDPTGGHTGSHIYGINLFGDYYCKAQECSTQYLTMGPVSCLGFTDVELSFYQWLNCDMQPYVRQTVEVSNNGLVWHLLWENSSNVTDRTWQERVFDISDTADQNETVYIRWGHYVGTDNQGFMAYPYSGWNIDDIMVKGRATTE